MATSRIEVLQFLVAVPRCVPDKKAAEFLVSSKLGIGHVWLLCSGSRFFRFAQRVPDLADLAVHSSRWGLLLGVGMRFP